MDRADFIVRQHDGDEDCLIRNRVSNLFGLHPAVFFYRQGGHGDAPFLEGFARVQDGPMLGHASDDVVALVFVHLHHAAQCQVIGFRGAAGKDEFFRIAVDELRDLRSRGFDGFLRLPPELMIAAGCIAKFLDEIWQHRLQDAGIHRSR